MLRLFDHFIIALPRPFDEGDGDFKKMNVAFYIDKERDRYERKALQGTIHSAPIAFRDINFMPIDPGFPPPRLFVGHDAIQRQINHGYKWSNAQYHPGTREHFDYHTIADYGAMITAKVGDPVYFHPSVTEMENYMGPDGPNMLFKAQVNEIICVRDLPQGGYVIVLPMGLESSRDGLQLSVDQEDDVQRGKVHFCRPGSGLLPGETVYFEKDSNWDFWIDEQRYFAMLEENIVGVDGPISSSLPIGIPLG